MVSCLSNKKESVLLMPCTFIALVSLAAVFSIVTQRSSPQTAEERCMMILKTAARETIIAPDDEIFFKVTSVYTTAKTKNKTN